MTSVPIQIASRVIRITKKYVTFSSSMNDSVMGGSGDGVG